MGIRNHVHKFFDFSIRVEITFGELAHMCARFLKAALHTNDKVL